VKQLKAQLAGDITEPAAQQLLGICMVTASPGDERAETPIARST
jgi:hypothetical protein